MSYYNEVLKGYLYLTIEEAVGKNQLGQYTWDTALGNFEGFVKVEIRGGPRSVKVQTRTAVLQDYSLTWKETLKLDLLEGANELRIILCKERTSSTGRKVPSIIAACGIYVKDILDSVPFDKYFELFKPNDGGERGYIRIYLEFKTPEEAAKDPAGVIGPARILDPAIAFAQAPVRKSDAVELFKGVVSKDSIDEVAERVVKMGRDADFGVEKKRSNPIIRALPWVIAAAASVFLGVAISRRGKTAALPPPPPAERDSRRRE